MTKNFGLKMLAFALTIVFGLFGVDGSAQAGPMDDFNRFAVQDLAMPYEPAGGGVIYGASYEATGNSGVYYADKNPRVFTVKFTAGGYELTRGGKTWIVREHGILPYGRVAPFWEEFTRGS